MAKDTSLVSKIWSHRRILRSLFKSIYFNFHYLPFWQAIRLPILLYKPKFLDLKGSVVIDADTIRFGMIRMGFPMVSLFPNSGITIENHGGTIIFNGKCQIGNNSAISMGMGKLTFGSGFCATTSLKIACYYNITFNDNVLIGWDCLFMDTDFHKLAKLSGGYSKGYGEIFIGKNNWFGCKCVVLKNTRTPDYCTVTATSLLNKNYDVPEYSVIGTSSHIEVKVKDVYRKIGDDKIIY